MSARTAFVHGVWCVCVCFVCFVCGVCGVCGTSSLLEDCEVPPLSNISLNFGGARWKASDTKTRTQKYKLRLCHGLNDWSVHRGSPRELSNHTTINLSETIARFIDLAHQDSASNSQFPLQQPGMPRNASGLSVLGSHANRGLSLIMVPRHPWQMLCLRHNWKVHRPFARSEGSRDLDAVIFSIVCCNTPWS